MRYVFRTVLNIWDRAFCENSWWFKPSTILTKRVILDLWLGSKYASDFNGILLIILFDIVYFCCCCCCHFTGFFLYCIVFFSFFFSRMKGWVLRTLITGFTLGTLCKICQNTGFLWSYINILWQNRRLFCPYTGIYGSGNAYSGIFYRALRSKVKSPCRRDSPLYIDINKTYCEKLIHLSSVFLSSFFFFFFSLFIFKYLLLIFIFLYNLVALLDSISFIRS